MEPKQENYTQTHQKNYDAELMKHRCIKSVDPSTPSCLLLLYIISNTEYTSSLDDTK